MASIAKNIGYLYVKLLVNIFISLYTTRLILRVLGAEDFGLWGVVGGAIAFLAFLNPALSQATQRFLSFYEGRGDNDKQQRVFSVSIVLHAVAALIVFVILEACAWPLFHGVLNIAVGRESAAMFVYQSLIASTCFTLMAVPYDATINAHEDMRYYAIVGIAESVMKLLATLLLTLDCVTLKLETYGICHVVITVVVLLVMYTYCRRHYKEARFSVKLIERNTLVEMAKFSFWNLTGTFTNIIGNYGSGIVSNHFFGTTINAALSVTGQLGGYLNTFSANMLKAFNPVIVKRAGSGDREDMLMYTMESCKMAFLLFSFFAVPVWIETRFVLQVWLGTVPLWTVVFIRLHFVRVCYEQIMASMKTAVNANGKIAGLNIGTSLSQLCSLPVMYAAFSYGAQPYWHLIIGMVFMAIIPGFIQLHYAHKLCGLSMRRYMRHVVIPSSACVALALLAGLVVHYLCAGAGDVVRFLLVGGIHVLVFGLSVYFVGLSQVERSYLLVHLRAVAYKIKGKREV